MPKPFHLARYLLLLLPLAGCSTAVADPYDCAPYVEPRIAVAPVYSEPRYDDGVSLAELQQLAGVNPYAYQGGTPEIPVGLTAASLHVDSSFEVTSRNLPGHMVCAQVADLQLDFGFNDTTVYLVRDLPRHSCGYETVLGHELKHVNTDQRLLEAYIPQLPGLLSVALRQIGTVRASSPAAAEAYFHDAVNNYLKQLGANIAGVRERWQQQIDTPQEYRRISLSCNGDVARLVQAETR